MTKIYIDTTDNKKVLVKLVKESKTFVKEELVGARSSQRVLPLIESLMQEHNLTVKNIDAIEVNEGPGSFTGVRVGVAIANAMAFGLGIPVNQTSITAGRTRIEPKY